MRIKNINITTGEEVERDMTAEELADIEQSRLIEEAEHATQEVRRNERNTDDKYARAFRKTVRPYIQAIKRGETLTVTLAQFLVEMSEELDRNNE